MPDVQVIVDAAVRYRTVRREVESLSAYVLQTSTSTAWDALFAAEQALLMAVDQIVPPTPAELERVRWLQRKHRAPINRNAPNSRV